LGLTRRRMMMYPPKCPCKGLTPSPVLGFGPAPPFWFGLMSSIHGGANGKEAETSSPWPSATHDSPYPGSSPVPRSTKTGISLCPGSKNLGGVHHWEDPRGPATSDCCGISEKTEAHPWTRPPRVPPSSVDKDQNNRVRHPRAKAVHQGNQSSRWVQHQASRARTRKVERWTESGGVS
jgi:hypothetical protein